MDFCGLVGLIDRLALLSLTESSQVGDISMTDQIEVPISADYFILSLMRLDRDHYQRIEAFRSVTGDDMDHFLFAPMESWKT